MATDPERHFRTDHIKEDIKGHTIRSGAVTMVAQVIKQVLTLGSTMVLARILTPNDYGLIAMVAAVIGFISLFKDLGLSMATIQREEIDHQQVSTLFWVNVGFSLGLFAMAIMIAPVITWYYSEPRLTWITICLSLGFLFGGLTVQHEALLRRQMRFRALAAIEITSLTLSMLVAVTAAVGGARYWALVLMRLTAPFTHAVGTWLMCQWIPGLPRNIANVRSMLAFGGNLTGFNVLNYFARNLDKLLIGHFFGAQQLGFYSKSYALLLLPLQQINRPITAVVVPALSRLTGSSQRYRQAYSRIFEKIAILTMPGVAFLIVTADWIVMIILGPQWTEAGRFFSLLGIAGLVQPLANTTGWLFITQDRTREMFHWGFIGSGIAVAAIIAGIPWGPIGVATCYSVATVCIQVPLLFWFVGRKGPVVWADFYRASAPAVCATIFVFVVLATFRKFVVISNPLIGIVAAFAMTILVTLTILMLLPAGRIALRDLRNSVTHLATN